MLAVGDAEFQKKCLGKMKDVAHVGRTVLFVSHNIGALTTLCTQGLVLHSGQVEFKGAALAAISYYASRASIPGPSRIEFHKNDPAVTVHSIQVFPSTAQFHESHLPLKATIRYTVHGPQLGLIVGFFLRAQDERVLVYSLVDDEAQPPPSPHPEGIFEATLTIPPNTFAKGTFRLELDLGIHNRRRIVAPDECTLVVEVENTNGIGRRYLAHDGIVRPHWVWQVEQDLTLHNKTETQ